MAELGLFEAMNSARALRRYKPDPIPDDVMTKILEAATKAPSGSNQQNWVFMVVKDPAKKKKISDIYHKGGTILTALYENRERPALYGREAIQHADELGRISLRAHERCAGFVIRVPQAGGFWPHRQTAQRNSQQDERPRADERARAFIRRCKISSSPAAHSESAPCSPRCIFFSKTR